MIEAKITFTGHGIYDPEILENLDELCDILNEQFPMIASFEVQDESSIAVNCNNTAGAEDVLEMVLGSSASYLDDAVSFMEEIGIKFKAIGFLNPDDD